MKLLIVFHSLYSLAGGVDNRLSQLETSLPDNIKREYLLFKDEVDLPHKAHITIAPIFKIPKVVLNNKKSLKLLAFFYGFINFLRRIYFTRKCIKKIQCDTILAVDDYFSLVVLCASIGLKKKIVCSVRNNWDQIYNGLMIHMLPDFMYKSFLATLMNRYASSIHCVSKGIQENLIAKYKIKNTHTIYNLFDFEGIRKNAFEPININQEFIINIGHLNFQKNQKDLIKAYAIMRQKGIKELLVLVGDGSERKNLELLAKDLRIDAFVIFVGRQKNPYKYLKKAKLYVSSSLYEGLPAVLIESLILDTPIVSYEFNYGSKELTSSISKMTPESLALKAVEVLNNKSIQEKLVQEGQVKLKESFNKELIIENWVRILS